MNKRFIKLHLNEDNSPVIVNVDDIISIQYDTKRKISTIMYKHSKFDMQFKESVDKIYNMIESVN